MVYVINAEIEIVRMYGVKEIDGLLADLGVLTSV